MIRQADCTARERAEFGIVEAPIENAGIDRTFKRVKADRLDNVTTCRDCAESRRIGRRICPGCGNWSRGRL